MPAFKGIRSALVAALILVTEPGCGARSEPSEWTQDAGAAPTHCERACRRLESCATVQGPPCASRCSDPENERYFLAAGQCLAELGCEQYQRSLSMDMGPFGDCVQRKLHGE